MWRSRVPPLERFLPDKLGKPDAQSQELTHGRQVTRTVTLYDAPPEVTAGWGNCQRVVWVERRGQRQGKAFCHRSAFITDLTLSAEALLPRIQDRWGIENRLHWVRDVTFLEDTPPRTGGHAPVNWSILHCWIINLVRQLGYRTLPQGIRVLTNQVQKVSHILLHGFSSA